MNWKTTLTLGLTALLITQPTETIAQDSTHTYRSASGDTTFPASALGTCAGKKVQYNTRYRGTSYQGFLWVQSPSGSDCEGGRGRTLSGYFEERGSNNDWCKGQLTVYLTNGPQGGSYARWDGITAVPGYSCAGAGTTVSLSLFYRDR